MSRSYRHGNRQKEKYYGENYSWWRQEPKLWRKLQKHKKRRTSCRKCQHEVMTGNEDILWPLDKKPWIYYY